MDEIPKITIVKAARGDLDAFEEIFKAYADYVFNIALRILHNKEDAEEVSQVVFMEIFDNLSTFRFKSSLKTWVYRITINAALNYKKKALRHSAVTYNDSLSTPTLLSAVEASIETEYYKSMIQRLLRCLTDEQRNCVVLRSVAGFSYQKIAHALNIRISAVRSRLKRARKKLFAVKKEIAADAL